MRTCGGTWPISSRWARGKAELPSLLLGNGQQGLSITRIARSCWSAEARAPGGTACTRRSAPEPLFARAAPGFLYCPRSPSPSPSVDESWQQGGGIYRRMNA